MKSRLAILSMLVAGMLLSTTGAGLAVTSVGGSRDASVSQYGGNEGDQGGGGQPSTSTGTGTGVQPARQVESGAGGGQLPFTGFLAIPVLLGGVALLGAGMVLRHRTANERE